MEDGREVAIGDLAPHRGACYSGRVRAFKGAGWMECRALAYWHVKHEEPWLLLSNDPSLSDGSYGLRSWEEACFRDLKSNGFQWQKSRVREPEHANRLWLALAEAYAWVMSLGGRVLRRADWWRAVARGRKERTSLFVLGLRLIERLLELGRSVPVQLRFPSSLFPKSCPL